MRKVAIAAGVAAVLAGGLALAGSTAWAEPAATDIPAVSFTQEWWGVSYGPTKVMYAQVSKDGSWKAFDFYTNTPDSRRPTWRTRLTKSEMKTLQDLAASDAFAAESTRTTTATCSPTEEIVGFTVTIPHNDGDGEGRKTTRLVGCSGGQPGPAEQPEPAGIRMPDTAATKMINIMYRGYPIRASAPGLQLGGEGPSALADGPA
jgi:hypothetical protein